MWLRNIVCLCLISISLLSCSGDNDDIVLAEDVSNIDMEIGITFGKIDPSNSSNTLVYKYSNNGTYIATNTTDIASNHVWEFSECPFDTPSLTDNYASDVQNVARGLRDLPSTDIANYYSRGHTFYIVEYTIADTTKTLQYYTTESFNDEVIDIYYDSIAEIIVLIGVVDEEVNAFNATTGSCE